MKGQRGQVMVEYIALMAIALLVLSIMLSVATNLLFGSASQRGIDAAKRTVETIREKVDFIYIHGHPSRTQTRVTIPNNINNITIRDRLIRLRVDVGDYYTDVYEITKANLTANISGICGGGCSPGNYLLIIESTEAGVVSITSNDS